ncbi:amidohydrolase family protein [Fulvimarina sp. MAC8]|uniref:amidohydrolase family protein n=1 Tax=Fulvimarina sp. MAC8 TaxID=3162874 RepID=UPI0032EB4A4C
MQHIDAHCHFWKLDRGDYGWLDGEGGPLDAIRRDFLPAQYPSDMDRIVVQAAPSEAETDFLLTLAKETPQIRGVVGWVDLTDPEAEQTLDRWSGDKHLLGLRPMLQDIEDTDWLLQQARPALVDRLIAQGLRFDALVTERHLPMFETFVDRHPDLKVVIDHAAKPQPGWGEGWASGMKALAGHEHIHCKLSGLLTELDPGERENPLAALQAIFHPLLDWFGPERLIWGSDWPVLTMAAPWQRWRDLTEELLSDLSSDERGAILSGNARRFYGLTS